MRVARSTLSATANAQSDHAKKDWFQKSTLVIRV